MTPAPLTAAELAALEAEHTPQVPPPCPVCGAARVESSPDWWWCPAARLHIPATLESGHFQKGCCKTPRTDPRILRLIAEVRASRGKTP